MDFPIGQNIKKLRTERNMTQRELANALKVSTQAVSKWETERAYPDLSLLVAISKLFEVSIDQLFGFK